MQIFKKPKDIQKIFKIFKESVGNTYDASIIKSLELLDNHPNYPETLFPNYLLFKMQVQVEHCNYIKKIHGGAVGTIVDISTSIALLMNDINRRISYTVQLQTNFFRAATVGEVIYILAKTDKIGKKLGNATCEIFGEKRLPLYNGSHLKSFLEESIKNLKPKLQLINFSRNHPVKIQQMQEKTFSRIDYSKSEFWDERFKEFFKKIQRFF